MTRLLLSAFLILSMAYTAAAQGIFARYAPIENNLFENPQPLEGPWARAPANHAQFIAQTVTPPMTTDTPTDALEVRAVHNSEWLAVYVKWEDTERNEHIDGNVQSDAVAISFPLKGHTTSPFMGDFDTPVEIIHWKAVWQKDVENGYADITDFHPNLYAEAYHGSMTVMPHELAKILEKDEARLAMPAIELNNPVSRPDRIHPVEQLMAEGYTGTITSLDNASARAWGIHKNGSWHVVFTRPLDTGDPNMHAMSPGEETVINFAVWDGQRGDVGARKSYTMWMQFKLENER